MGPLSMIIQAPVPNQPRLFLECASPMTERITFGKLAELAAQFEPLDTEDDDAREDRQWQQMAEQSKTSMPATTNPIYTIKHGITLFGAQTEKEWNMSTFGSDQSVIHLMDKAEWFPGIHTSYTYFGMFGTFFSYHREDRNLFSANYLHWGKPKVWYAIPQSHAAYFEEVVQSYVSIMTVKNKDRFNLNCSLVARHRQFIVSPSFLKHHNIPFSRVLQRQGEIIISLSGVHGGLNLGFNMAESLNFALDPWFFEMYDDYKISHKCK